LLPAERKVGPPERRRIRRQSGRHGAAAKMNASSVDAPRGQRIRLPAPRLHRRAGQGARCWRPPRSNAG
jgi:hypothetical protein